MMFQNQQKNKFFQEAYFNLKTEVRNNLSKQSKIKLTKTIIEHKSYVCSICLLKDGRLASSSADNKIKVFDLSTDKCDITITGHTNSVLSVIEFSDNVLISCSSDKSIKIWKIFSDTFECIHSFEGHTETVWKVIQLSPDLIMSCSSDKSIKIWTINPTFNCKGTLMGHTDIVYSLLRLKDQKYIASCGQKEINFWGTQDYKRKKNIQGVYCRWNNSLAEVNEKIIVGDVRMIVVINTQTLQIEAKIKISCGGYIYSIIKMDEANIICGSEKGELIKINTIAYQSILLNGFAHSKCIFDLLQVDKNIFVSSGLDNSIKFWEIPAE